MLRSILKNIYFFLEKHLLTFKRKKDVLFYVENELMLNYANHIYRLLRQDKRLRLWFCLVYHKKRSLNWKGLKTQITGRIIPYWIAKQIKWDLILYPNHGPYFRNDCSKIYVGHGINSGHVINGENYCFGSESRDSTNRIIYEKIFVSSDFTLRQVRKNYPEFYPKTKVVGSLLRDELYGADFDKKAWCRALNFDQSLKTILFASTWGSHSLIQSQGDELINQIKRMKKKYNIILSVHLNNYTNAHYKGADIQGLLCRLKGENVHIMDPKEGGHNLFPMVDLLIVDKTSLGLYYPPLKRPIIFYDNPKVGFTESSLILELKKATYVVKNVLRMQEDIEAAFECFNRSEMEELASKIFSYPGCSSPRYVQEICESLNLEEYQSNFNLCPA